MMYEIKITGTGTTADLVTALRSVANEIEKEDHLSSIEKFGTAEWEDATLMTVIDEYDEDEDEDEEDWENMEENDPEEYFENPADEQRDF